jgi:hypothetical protein
VVVLAVPAWAQPAEVNGSIDVSAVQAEVDGEERNTLQQRYSINVARDLTSTLRARASFRYFDFDIDGAEQFGAFREEIQPSAEVAWRTEWFRSSVTGLRRSIRSSATSGRLITENVVADWRSAIDGWPMLTLRYDWQKISEEDGGDDARDTRDRRFLARLNVDRENEIIEYGFTRRWTENLIRGLESRENSHQFRFLGSHSLAGDGRLRLDTQYLFTYRDRIDEVRTGTVLLEQVTTGQPLFAVDPSPELGTLQPVPGLADGNTGTATVPGIEIGTGSIDRNIGTDLGFEREAVSAMYVYVDRFSSSTVDWSVYVSEDGIEWNEVTDTPIQTFNTALLRYEIEFVPVSTRYLKVVNGGTNDAPVVFVTEIEVYEALQETDEVSREATTHLANTTLGWRATESLDLTLDASARLEPAQGTVGDREGYDYAARARWQMVDDLQWSGRWEQAWQRFGDSRPTLRDDVVSTSLLYDPLPTLGSTLSASHRRSLEGDRTQRTIDSAFLSTDLRPIPGLGLVVDALVSEIDDPALDRSSDLWSLRGSVDAEVTGSLRVLGSWAHRETTTHPDEELVVRRTWTVDADLQLTERIFARAGLTWVEDRRFSRRQDYLLNWRIGPRVVITGQMILDDATGGFLSDRRSLNATIEINRSTSAYVRYAEVEQGGPDGRETLSWQQGLRMTF